MKFQDRRCADESPVSVVHGTSDIATKECLRNTSDDRDVELQWCTLLNPILSPDVPDTRVRRPSPASSTVTTVPGSLSHAVVSLSDSACYRVSCTRPQSPDAGVDVP